MVPGKLCSCPVASSEIEQKDKCLNEGVCEDFKVRVSDHYCRTHNDNTLTYSKGCIQFGVPYAVYLTNFYGGLVLGTSVYDPGEFPNYYDGYYESGLDEVGTAELKSVVWDYLNDKSSENKDKVISNVNSVTVINDARFSKRSWKLVLTNSNGDVIETIYSLDLMKEAESVGLPVCLDTASLKLMDIQTKEGVVGVSIHLCRTLANSIDYNAF
jgi:hypothetical protein